jgi:outer membrane lipase/esterase
MPRLLPQLTRLYLCTSALIGGLAAGVLSTSLPSSALAQTSPLPYENVLVFGDSLSDNGNLFAISGQPPAPYFNGRFSNGPVWVEQVFTTLGRLTNPGSFASGNIDFAFGGAVSGSTAGQLGQPPGLIDQLNSFDQLRMQGAVKVDSRDVAIYWGGANDYLNLFARLASDPNLASNPSAVMQLAQATVGGAITNLLTGVGRLAASGVTTIIVPNLPDLGATPQARAAGAASAAQASQITTLHNQNLQAQLEALAARLPGVNIVLMPIDALFGSVVLNPTAFGFNNISQACLNATAGTLCGATQSDQNKFLFWDGVHPTTAGHALIAQLFRTLADTTENQTQSAKAIPQSAVSMAATRAFSAALTNRLRQARAGTATLTVDQAALALFTTGGIDHVRLADGADPNRQSDVVSSVVASAPEAGQERPFAFFVAGGRLSGDGEAQGAAPGYDYDNNRLVLGFDYRVGPHFVLGMAGSYHKGEAELSTPGSEGFDTKGFDVGFYASYFTDAFYIDGTIAVGTNDLDDITRITGFPGLTAIGNTSANYLQFGIGAGYNFQFDALSLTPRLGLRNTALTIDRYTESRARGLELSYSERDVDAVVGEIGAEASYLIATDFGYILPTARFGLEHDFVGENREVVGKLANNSAQGVRADGGEADRTVFTLGAGVNADYKSFGLGLDYDVDLNRDGGTEHSVFGSVNLRF